MDLNLKLAFETLIGEASDIGIGWSVGQVVHCIHVPLVCLAIYHLDQSLYLSIQWIISQFDVGIRVSCLAILFVQ